MMIKRIQKLIDENKNQILQLGIMGVVMVVPMMMGGTCEAATSSAKMPWSTGVNALQAELTGPIPKVLGVCDTFLG